MAYYSHPFCDDQAPRIKQQTSTEKPLNLDPTEASVNELHRLGYGEVESNGDGVAIAGDGKGRRVRQ